MFNIKKVVIAYFVCATPMICGLQNVKASSMISTTYTRQEIGEYSAVQEIAGKFIEGVKTGNAEIMKPFFHKKAAMFGQYDAVKEAGSIQLLFDSLSRVGPCGEDYIARVDVVALENNAAVVKVIEDGWHGYNFTDFLIMQKIDGLWKIVAKVYDTVSYQ